MQKFSGGETPGPPLHSAASNAAGEGASNAGAASNAAGRGASNAGGEGRGQGGRGKGQREFIIRPP